jgi:hypothetical protein
MPRKLRPRPWWRNAANLIGAFGLLVALGGTTWGVWAGVAQSRDARFYSQLAVLTQLSAEARASDRSLASKRMSELRCKDDYQRGDLTPQDQQNLQQSLDVYEVMAWVFNKKLGPDTARRLWGPRIVDTRALALRLLTRDEVATGWKELASFSPAGINPLPDPCP